MWPFVPIAAWLAVIFGGGTLWWYSQLPPKKKAEADSLFGELAWDLFNKQVDQLNASETDRVHEMARRHFFN